MEEEKVNTSESVELIKFNTNQLKLVIKNQAFSDCPVLFCSVGVSQTQMFSLNVSLTFIKPPASLPCNPFCTFFSTMWSATCFQVLQLPAVWMKIGPVHPLFCNTLACHLLCAQSLCCLFYTSLLSFEVISFCKISFKYIYTYISHYIGSFYFIL